MAIFFMSNEGESFTSFTGGVTTSTDVALSGINRAGMVFSGSGANGVADFTAQTEGWLHFRYRRSGALEAGGYGEHNGFALRNAAGTILIRFVINSFNEGVVVHPLSQPPFSIANIGDIDVQWKISASDGFLRLWRNGINLLNFEGNTSLSSGTQNISQVFFGGTNDTLGFPYSMLVSQVLVSDLPTLNAEVHTLPLTVSTPNDWTGTPANVTGASYSGLGNAITENTADQKIRFTMADLPALTGSKYIGGLTVAASALAEVGSPVPKLAFGVFNGTTEAESTPTTLTTTFQGRFSNFSTNPNGGAAWTVTTLNAAQISLIAKA